MIFRSFRLQLPLSPPSSPQLPNLPRFTSRRRLKSTLALVASFAFLACLLATIAYVPEDAFVAVAAVARRGKQYPAAWTTRPGPADAVLQGRKVYDEEGHELWNMPDRLLPGERYLLTGHIAGWTNQYMGTVHSIHLALLTNRTPIIPYYRGYASQLGESLVTPPLPNLAFSEVFDLPRLFDSLRATPLGSGLRGIVDIKEVLEINRGTGNGGRGWPDWRLQGTAHERVEIGGGWNDLAGERWELGCWKAHGEEGLGYLLEEARIQPVFSRLPLEALPHDPNLVIQRPVWSGLLKFLAAAPETDRRVDRMLEAMDDSDKGAIRPSSWVTCIDSLYFASASPSQWPWQSWQTPSRPSAPLRFNLSNPDVVQRAAAATESDAPGPWETVGQYMHWFPELEQRGRAFARLVLGVADEEELPLYISVHIRRGDFLKRCDPSRESCFSLAAFRLAVDAMRARLLAEKGVVVDRVLFATDETDPAFLQAAAELGWNRVEDEQSLEVRRAYGDWFPMLLDNVLLSLGKGLVGTSLSTMSLVNGRRVEYWNDGLTSYLEQWAPEA